MTQSNQSVVVHVRGADLLKSPMSHDGRTICPAHECGLDLGGVGITALAYTYEVCECPRWHYPHLVEQLWHRDCLADS